MKKSLGSVPVILVAACICPLQAQEVSLYLGFGGTHDSSAGGQIDTFGDGNLYKTPSLGGVFGHVGATAFFGKRFGVGGEITWRPTQGDYVGIQYRPTFYTFDAIFRPSMFNTKRF